jgi:hypothetical protein
MLDWVPFSFAGFSTGGLGMLFDRERGLLGYAPIYLLVPACAALEWRRSRWLSIPILALLVPLAAFVTWTGGFSPAARFIMPVTPLLTLPVVRALDDRVVRWCAVPLVAFQVAITALAWWHPRDLWPKEVGTNQLLEKIPWVGPAWERWLPSIATGDATSGGWWWVAIVAVLTTAVTLIAKGQRVRE